MYVGKILYIIDKMKKNHAVPNVIGRMNMMRKFRKILLDIDYLLRNLQFLEMFALNMFILIHPLEETELGQKFVLQI